MWGWVEEQALPPPSNHSGVSGGGAGYPLKVLRAVRGL